MRIIQAAVAHLKIFLKKSYYGKVYNEAFIAAEANIANKVHNIDQLYTKSERKKLFFEGFTSDKFLWYDFNKYRKEDYITDYEHYALTENIDKHQYFVANDKLVCERMLQPFCNVLTSIGYVFNGTYYPIGEQGMDLDSLVESIKSGEEYYCKPNGGGSGRGIGRIWFKNGSIFWNNDLVNDVKAFICSLEAGNDGYLVQRRFIQKGFSHDVNPDTLNTVRLVTMMDPYSHEPFLAWAFHRFGRKGSFVDNVAQANLLCPINIKTGIIEKVLTPPIEGKVGEYECHPDTLVQIAGIKLPHWEEAVDLAFRLAKQLPFMPLCGWDIIASGDELYMQELNYNPDIYAGQILYPLLQDPKVKKFIDYYRKQ